MKAIKSTGKSSGASNGAKQTSAKGQAKPREFIHVNTSKNTLANKGMGSNAIRKSTAK